MRRSKALLLIAVAIAALAHNSDGQAARPVAEQLGLAQVMPRGAMVYVQARDLAALMRTWLASPVRQQFYKSQSFAAFSRSRIYLKLQDRKKDFESAIGFGLDESRLAELAGGASAVSIYDIGRLELVFATEVARERAVATALFKQAPQFQERSAEGSPYYVRDVTTDGGRLSQQFCFAYANGRLIVTTAEGLMIRALRNSKGASADSLLSDVLASAERANGFTSHEVTMWLDQARLNKNRHFNNYWIHRNPGAGMSLAAIETGLIDLRITPQGLTEQRWFKIGDERAQPQGLMSGDQAAALLRFAPADAQLVELRAGDSLSESLSQVLFGKLVEAAAAAPEIADRTRSTGDEDGASRTERYSRLDTRFDVDVDDETAPARGALARSDARQSPAGGPPASEFEKRIASIFGAASVAAYGEVARSTSDSRNPFVRFERAMIIETKAGVNIDRQLLERAITDELRARFVVAGVEPGLVWQDEGSVRYVAQSLLEQGAAYSVSGRYFVMASSRELVGDILKAASRPPATVATIDAPVGYYGLVRVTDARPVFDKLMSKLDGRAATVSGIDDEDSQGEHEVKFFSENLSSLIAATAIREVRVRRESNASGVVERVVYAW